MVDAFVELQLALGKAKLWDRIEIYYRPAQIQSKASETKAAP